jgi:antitoxin component YwqK of YwqJK toxin-antitoxin module
LLSLHSIAKSQTINKFYDLNWKETDAAHARFFSEVKKTDSGWHRADYFLHEENNIQMDGTYLDSACKIANGIFYYFHYNKKISMYGRYVNGKKEGLWLSYYKNGVMKDSSTYKSGGKIGTSQSWYPNGNPKDSIVIGESLATNVTWFDNGQLSSAGRTNNKDKMVGVWQFYHINGKLASKEVYDIDGFLKTKNYYDESGNEVDTSRKNKAAEFPGGIKAWQKYLGNKLYFPPNVQITNSDQAAVMVEFVINEEGKVEYANTVVPFYRIFNDIAESVILRSPKWQPAIEHNRRVKFYFTQGVTFAQTE